MQLLEEEDIRATQQTDQVKKYALKLLRRWPYILIFFLVALLVGYAVNRYATPVYLVKARITTKKYSGKATSPIPGLVDASFFLSGLTEVYEEIPILKSPKRIEAAINRLDLRVSYFAEGAIKTVESTRGSTFEVKLDSLKGQYPFGVPIYVNPVSETAFELRIDNGGWSDAVKGKRYNYDAPVYLGNAVVRITKTGSSLAERDKYYFVINRNSDLANVYRNRLNINWTMKGSAMLDLQIESELPERELQFLKAYYDVVQEFALAEKNETLDNTIRFIDAQMKSVTDSLLYYQSLIDNLKLSNSKLAGMRATTSTGQLVPGSGSEIIYAQLGEIDRKKAEIQMQERYLDYLTNYFRTKSTEEIFAPSLVGLQIPLLEGWVNQFINQKLTDKLYRNEENLNNPLVNRSDSLRSRLEKGIFEAIASERERNRQNVRDLERQAQNLLGSIKDVQSDFRELSRYERLYQLNMVLYDLFIRRKTEAAISKASATPDYQVIDAPSVSGAPIKPDKRFNLIIAAAIGLFLPIGFFLFRDVTNPRIMDKDDLLAHTQMPVLGNIAHSEFPSRLVMKEHPRSVVAESFRAVRANLRFLAAGITTKSHTFLVTSSIGGEGKTFCSLNLAYTLTLSQKKAIVMAADLRKPELGNYLQRFSDKGLSAYLAGYATIEELIVHGDESQPDFIDAGKIPPNPAELLGSERMKLLMTYLKERYDYILIDTPPIGLVSDAMELFKYTDYNLLIVRQGITQKAALDMVNELYMEGKLKNFSVVFNDIELFRTRKSIYGGYVYGMGYGGYGYGYYEEDKGRG
jgi:capsular exopolysaccharide synthesis family protein